MRGLKAFGWLCGAAALAVSVGAQAQAEIPAGSSLPPWLQAAIGEPGSYNASYVGLWGGKGGMLQDPGVGEWNTRDAAAAGLVAGIAGNTKRIEVSASQFGDFAYGKSTADGKRELNWTTYSINYYRFLASRALPVAPYLAAGVGTGKGHITKNDQGKYKWVSHWNVMAGVDMDVLPYEGYTLYAEGRRTGMTEKLDVFDDGGSKYQVQTLVVGVKAWFTPEGGSARGGR